jgi:hypothetical protein
MLHRHRTLSWAKIVRRVCLLRVAALRQLALQRVGFDDPGQFLGADWPGNERPASGIPGFGIRERPRARKKDPYAERSLDFLRTASMCVAMTARHP